MSKKLVSMLLALSLCLGMLPAQAMAAEVDVPEEEAPPVEDVSPVGDELPAEAASPVEETPPAEDAAQDEAELLEATSGNCGDKGDNITWSLDDAGTLTIRGSGDMQNYHSYTKVPWYSNPASVKEIIIEQGVTSIGNYAFRNGSSLASVTIPSSVISIGNNAFENCTALTSVTISNGVTSIGSYAFQNCTALTSVTIPDSVTTIGGGAFRNTALTSVTIPNSVTAIGGNTFEYCSSLTDVTISDNVTSIGAYAFSYCTSLKSVTVPDRVTSIGKYAFERCRSLMEATIPASVISIGTFVFVECANLANVYYYGSEAQWEALVANKGIGMAADTEVHIVVPGEDIIKYKVPGGYICFNTATRAVVSCDSAVTAVALPGTIKGVRVEAIGDEAFKNCSGLTSVEIPNSVYTIGNDAFFGCQNLTSVAIGKTVGTIGDRAFMNCTSLPGVEIPNSVTSIGEHAFANCQVLAWVIMGYSVKSIGKYAFSNCNVLTSVNSVGMIDIPDSVESIGESAFAACQAFTNLNVPDSVKSIGNGAFYGCNSLESVTLSKGIPSIGERMFAYCGSLASVTIPNSVTSIGASAFLHCGSLECVNFGGSVRSIGDAAFSECNGLKNVYYPDSEQDWKKIAIGDDNACLTGAWIHYGFTRSSISDFSYSFANSPASFDYAEGDKHPIPYERFAQVFGNNVLAATLHSMVGWEGNCFGLSATSGMFFQFGSGINTTDFDSAAYRPSSLHVWNKNLRLNNMTLQEFIEAMQVAHNALSVQFAYNLNKFNFKGLCEAVSDFQETGENPPVIELDGPEGGHALLGYAIVPVSATESRLMVYDSNYPNVERYIKLTLDGKGDYTGWYYHLGYTNDGKPIEYGTGYGFLLYAITYIPYDTYYAVWEGRSDKARTGSDPSSMALLFTNTENAEIYDNSGEVVAEIINGELKTDASDIFPMVYTDQAAGGGNAQPEQIALWLPVDVYTVKNKDDASTEDFQATMANVEQSASVTTTGDTVTFAVSDDKTINYASLEGAGKDYTITLTSSLSGTIEEVELSGTTASENVSFAQISDKLYAEGAEDAELKKDGNSVVDKELNTPPDIPELLDSVTAIRTNDAKTVRLSPGRQTTIPDGADIFAAQYEGGKMKTVLKGEFNASTMKVTFGRELTGDWTFFFLDNEKKPLCSKADLS